MALWVFQTIPNNRMRSSPSRKRQKLGTDIAPASPLPVVLAGSNYSTNVQAKDPSTAATSSASDEGTPTLPPAVWGHVLDYLLYGEVRQAILVNKAMANEASKYVQDIHITEPCQLDVVAARRFSSVVFVEIKCLVSWPDLDTCVLSPETATNLVPFLSSFPKLDKFFIADYDAREVNGEFRQGYCPRYCITYDHEMIMRDLTKSFCAAFRSRALSPKLSFLGGLSPHYSRTHKCRHTVAVEGSSCDLCREILLTFPPSFVSKLLRWNTTLDDEVGSMSGVCITPSNYADALNARRFDKDFIKDNGKEIVLNNLALMCYRFDLKEKDPKEKKLRQRLEEEGVNTPTTILRFGVDFDVLDTISIVIENGFDPKTISKEELYEIVDLEGRIAMFADDLEELCELGIPFDRNKISTVERSEVGL